MKNRRFNIADAIILLVAVLCVLGIIMRVNHIKSGKYQKDEQYRITFSASGLTSEETEKLEVGAKFRTDGGAVFGTLTEGYWTEPDDSAESFSLIASVACSGTATETGLLSGGNIYRIGDKIAIECGSLRIPVTVTGFEKTE